MRALGALEALQKSMGDAICKVVLAEKGNGNTYTYGVDTTNRILNLNHTEQEWSQTANILVDNRDKILTALDLTGYTATISYGYDSTYSASAPLEVIAQNDATILRPRGDLLTSFGCAGVFNMMGLDEASAEYTQKDSNADTVKTLLTAIANKTLPCFTHCKLYAISFDDDDTLIDTFAPADYFKVAFKESRLSAFRKLLKLTKCKARIEADGAIHVFDPVISGSTYDYEYDDEVTEHNFFEKGVRNALVLPNRVYVDSHSDQGIYTGNATNPTSYDALKRYVNEYHNYRVTSDVQAADIATAIQQGYTVGQEIGHGFAPMNCGQEVLDYVLITDSVAGDTRAGNIGYINRIYRPSVFEFEFRFGALEQGGIAGIIQPQNLVTVDPTARAGAREALTLVARVDALEAALARLYKTFNDNVETTNENNTNFGERIRALEEKDTFTKLTVTEQLIIPVWPKGENS